MQFGSPWDDLICLGKWYCYCCHVDHKKVPKRLIICEILFGGHFFHDILSWWLGRARVAPGHDTATSDRLLFKHRRMYIIIHLIWYNIHAVLGVRRALNFSPIPSINAYEQIVSIGADLNQFLSMCPTMTATQQGRAACCCVAGGSAL